MKMAARFSVVAFQVPAFGADEVAGPGRERGEGDPVFLVRLLHAGGLEVLQDHLGEVLLVAVARSSASGSISSSFSSTPSMRCGREALDGERPGHADLLLVVVGLVVEVFELGLGGDGGVDLLLPGDAGLPPFGVQLLRRRPATSSSASRGISHSCQVFLSAAFSCSRSGSSFACHLSQMTSISALLAIDLSVMCGTRS